jgi:hypothetical protein
MERIHPVQQTTDRVHNTKNVAIQDSQRFFDEDVSMGILMASVDHVGHGAIALPKWFLCKSKNDSKLSMNINALPSKVSIIAPVT